MNKTVLIVMGCLLVAAGLLGFAAPGLFGMHLSPFHNGIHLLSGLLALFFGVKESLGGAKVFSLIFGTVYGLLGLFGLILGGASGLWVIIPNQLTLGLMDHFVHLAVGGLFLFAGLHREHTLVTTQPRTH